MLLPVFAAKITGNPHYFDVGTTAEKILLYILEFCFSQEKRCEMSEVEQKNQLLYKAGILKDDLSNDVLVFGMRGWKYDGTVHEGIEGFFHTGEPVRLTLKNSGKDQKYGGGRKNVYLLENPAVFSAFYRKKSGLLCCLREWAAAALCSSAARYAERMSLLYYMGLDPEDFDRTKSERKIRGKIDSVELQQGAL